MGLREATNKRGGRIVSEGHGPIPAVELAAWKGKRVQLPCEDPWVRGQGDAAHAYLDGARAAWHTNPEYMDFLRADSPCGALKALERDLYLHTWAPWLEGADTVLDVGCGVGRFVLPMLDKGCTVWGVDADHESLLRCLWRAAGRPGRLDLHWSSVHSLPDVVVDVAIAAEVLCYVPEVERALAGLVARVRPGGAVLISMEARWGWAASPDAPAGSLEAALAGDGVVHVPGEGWVHTRTREEVEALLRGAGLEVEAVVASHYTLDAPLEQVAGASHDLQATLEMEARCRAHPVWGPLNRLWLAAARKPG
jgi:2-polyprenyl-3-methyl-5-hydroxy-6-metoxy-1,4-benzoquinol methylase